MEIVKQLDIPVKGKGWKETLLQDECLHVTRNQQKIVPKTLFYSLLTQRKPMNFMQFFQQE